MPYGISQATWNRLPPDDRAAIKASWEAAHTAPPPPPSPPAQTHPVQPAEAQTIRPAVRSGAYIDTGAGYTPAASLPPPAPTQTSQAKTHPTQPIPASTNTRPIVHAGAYIDNGEYRVQSAAGAIHPTQPIAAATRGRPVVPPGGAYIDTGSKFLAASSLPAPAAGTNNPPSTPKPNRFRADWGTHRLALDLHLTAAENYIIFHESTWNPLAKNGQYFGLGQLSPEARIKYLGRNANTTDPQLQLNAMRRYIYDRYGTEAAAVAFWEQHHWY